MKFAKSQPKEAVDTSKMIYAVVRTYSAGVFIGAIEEGYEGKETLNVYNARRLWYWSGAASLSQLAMEGVKNPEKCKFPCEVEKVALNGVIEVIPATEECKKSIDSVDVWQK